MTEPWSLKFLRAQWHEQITNHMKFESPETEMRAIMAERRYVFAWRRWRCKLMGAARPHAVRHPDPAIGWMKERT